MCYGRDGLKSCLVGYTALTAITFHRMISVMPTAVLLLLLRLTSATPPQPPHPPPCDANQSGPQPWFYPPQHPQQQPAYGPGFGNYGGDVGGGGWQPQPLQFNDHLQRPHAPAPNNSFVQHGGYNGHLNVQPYGQQQQYGPQHLAGGQFAPHQQQPSQQNFAHHFVPPPPPPPAPVQPRPPQQAAQQAQQFAPPLPPVQPPQPRLQQHQPSFFPGQGLGNVFAGESSQSRRSNNNGPPPPAQQATPSRGYRNSTAFHRSQRLQTTPAAAQATPSRRNEPLSDNRRLGERQRFREHHRDRRDNRDDQNEGTRHDDRAERYEDRQRGATSSGASSSRARKHRSNDVIAPRIGLSRRETLREAATRKKDTSSSDRHSSKSRKEKAAKSDDDAKKRRPSDG